MQPMLAAEMSAADRLPDGNQAMPTYKSMQPPRNSFEVQIIESFEGICAFIDQWQAFAKANVRGKCLFNDPIYVQLALESDPDKHPRIMVLRREGQICCIAPFYICPGNLLIQASVIKLASLPVRWAKVFGDAFLIADDEDSESCYQSVFTELAKHQDDFDILGLDRVEVGGDLWNFCSKECTYTARFQCFLASPQMELAHQIHFPPSHGEYMAALGSRTRQNLRRMTRKLVGERQARLERITTIEELPRFLEQVDRVYRDTWQAKVYGHRQRNSPAELDLMGGLARQGWLRSYLLSDCSGPIAFDIAFQYDGVFHAQEIGYSQAAAEHSPGTVLMHLYIEDLYRENLPAKLDFGVGDATYKRSLCNAQLPVTAVLLVARARWRAIIRFQRMIYFVERSLRWLAKKLRIDRFLRKLIKRQR